MLSRLILFLSITIAILQAQTQKIEILAKTLNKESTVIHGKDNVVLYSDKYIITADEAYYDYNTSDLELIGNITIMQGATFSTRSGYAKLNMNNDSGHLTPMFAYTGVSQMWMKCNNAKFDAKYYITKKSILSSCDVQNPDWKIGFTTGEYDREKQFLYTYNTLFYIADMPIFYLPYFSFPTDTTRRTGFLRPEISFGSDEGIYYIQPMYFAPQANWDFQLNPQIRTNRGSGLHGILRFADSPYSSGEISLGQFKEKNDYFEKEKLKNNKHHGYSIRYDRSKLFSEYFSETVEDGLWIDFNYLNDIDYFNTIDNDEKNYDSLIQSTLNYYIRRDLDYFGLYSKYYIATKKGDNGASIEETNYGTTQEVPSFHYHRFSNNILADNVFYSVDYQVTNFMSRDGFEAITHQIDAPITIYFPLLNDFLHFKASENFYVAKVNYEDGVKSGGGNVLQNIHRFSLFTELAKPYESFYHTMYLGLEYTLPGKSKKSNGFKLIEDDTSLDEFDSLLLNTQENISINLIEFFYNKEGRKLVSHSLRQSIVMGDLANDEYKYKDLSNNIQLYFSKDLTLSNLLNYSHELSRFSKFQTSLNWKIEDYTTSFIHTYQKNSDDKIDNYLTFSIDTNYIKNYNLFASMNYDAEDDYFKSWQVGWTMKKKCWDYRISYREEIEPNSSFNGSTNKRGVYLTFNLYPLGGISYNFTKESKSAE